MSLVLVKIGLEFRFLVSITKSQQGY